MSSTVASSTPRPSAALRSSSAARRSWSCSSLSMWSESSRHNASALWYERSAATSKSSRRRERTSCSSSEYSKPARISSSSRGGDFSLSAASSDRCCCWTITKPANARDGSAGSATSGNARQPHRKARSWPVASLSRANASSAASPRRVRHVLWSVAALHLEHVSCSSSSFEISVLN
eukprot:1760989-Prymnesium_polylepis.2